jgi:hypothetical protein
MKTINYLTILVSILFYSSGFSQNDSISVVNKSDVMSFHKRIFQLPVDTIIDSTSIYKLLYSSGKEWSTGLNNPNHKKKYKSKHNFAYFTTSKVPMIRILTFPKPYKDTTYHFLNTGIVSSNKDNLFKILKKRKFDDNSLTGIISLGGKYLLVAKKTTYIGNHSWSSTKYLYYEKIE